MFEEQIERIIALQEGGYWIALEQEALPLLLEMQAKLNDLQNRVDDALVQLRLEYNERLFSEHYVLGLKKEDIARAIEILTGEGE